MSILLSLYNLYVFLCFTLLRGHFRFYSFLIFYSNVMLQGIMNMLMWSNAMSVYEYIDVVKCNISRSSERLIIDIDFQSHFEIARAVDSYDRILKSLPVVYVGSLNRLKQYLQVMVEAAKSSLKQNSMPLPPWRSLAYLQAKWHSPY